MRKKKINIPAAPVAGSQPPEHEVLALQSPRERERADAGAAAENGPRAGRVELGVPADSRCHNEDAPGVQQQCQIREQR